MAEALFRSKALTDDQAAEVFDRVFGWAAAGTAGWAVELAADPERAA